MQVPGQVGRWGRYALYWDTAQNAVQVGRGGYDIYENGLTWAKGLQVGTGLLGLGGGRVVLRPRLGGSVRGGPGFPGNDPTKPPPGFEWRGRPGSTPGSREGNYYNPSTGETLRPDLSHPSHSAAFFLVSPDTASLSRRRGRDSNPRYPCGYNGFRDRPDQPLRHLSELQAVWQVYVKPSWPIYPILISAARFGKRRGRPK